MLRAVHHCVRPSRIFKTSVTGREHVLAIEGRRRESGALLRVSQGRTGVAAIPGSERWSCHRRSFPVVTIGGSPDVVGFAGLISPGLYQFNVTVPSSVTSGDAALTATFGGQQTQAGVKLTIQ